MIGDRESELRGDAMDLIQSNLVTSSAFSLGHRLAHLTPEFIVWTGILFNHAQKLQEKRKSLTCLIIFLKELLSFVYAMPNRNAHAAHQTCKTANIRTRRKPTKEVATETAIIATRQTRSLKSNAPSANAWVTPKKNAKKQCFAQPKEKTKYPKKQSMSRIRLSSVGVDLALGGLVYRPVGTSYHYSFALDDNRSLKISFHRAFFLY